MSCLVLSSVCLVTAMTLAPSAHARTVPSADALREARAYAKRHEGPARISWAVFDTRGRLFSRDGARHHRSASQTKAMLLVAYLRRLGDRPVPRTAHRVLAPMIEESDNDAADAMHDIVGDAGLASVGRAVGMRHLELNGTWSEVGITAADQARFFLRFDRIVPRRHRPYARRLLSSIVPPQSWGIARPAKRLGFRVFFKGGWRTKLVNQGALLVTGDRRRLAIVVLTDGADFGFGTRAIEQLAERLLRDTRTRRERARERAAWEVARLPALPIPFWR